MDDVEVAACIPLRLCHDDLGRQDVALRPGKCGGERGPPSPRQREEHTIELLASEWIDPGCGGLAAVALLDA